MHSHRKPTEPDMDYENDPLYQELTANIIHRDQLIARFMEENQYDIDSECGYPDTSILTAEDFWDRYRRDPIARRVVNILPMESWRRNPEVYDDEDEEKETPFEKSLVAAAKSLYKSYSKSDTALTHLWSCLQTADILAGVGSYGVILIGINDGRQLREPAPGFEEDAGGIYDYTSTYNERRRKEEKKSGTRKNMELTYLRPFSQKHVQVTSFETDENNFRYQQPKMYLITLNDTERSSLGLNAPHGTVEVHWSRIVHIVDTPEESELETDSRLLPVWNRLHDLQKVYGPSAEGFWQGALPGLTLQPFMEGITFGKAERDSMTKQLEMYRKKMKRYLASDAASINQLSPMVTDPSNHITVQINSICVHLAVPVRIFLGSERGELASSQDSDAHDDRMEERREKRVTPRIVCPVLDRLIDLGVLDKPQGEGYTVKWPPFRNKTPAEIAERASAITGAVAQYISGGVSELIEPLDYLTHILDLDKDTAQQLLENAEDSDFEITPPGQPPSGEAPGMEGGELPPPEEDEELPSPQPKAPPQPPKQPTPTGNRFSFQTGE